MELQRLSEVVVGDLTKNYSLGFRHSLHLPSQPEKKKKISPHVFMTGITCCLEK